MGRAAESGVRLASSTQGSFASKRSEAAGSSQLAISCDLLRSQLAISRDHREPRPFPGADTRHLVGVRVRVGVGVRVRVGTPVTWWGLKHGRDGYIAVRQVKGALG